MGHEYWLQGALSRAVIYICSPTWLCLPSDFVRVITMWSERSRRTRCRRSEEVYIDQTDLLDRLASLLARLRQLDYINWEPSDVICPKVSYRGDVESRYSMAAEIPVKASHRIATEAIRDGGGLTLHKYKPAVTGTIPRLSRRRRSSVNTYLSFDAHTHTQGLSPNPRLYFLYRTIP